MNLASWLARAARDTPDRVGVWLGEGEWKRFGRLAGDVASLARALRESFGLAPGERVALVMKNVPEYAEVLLASWWAGLAAVPVNAKLHPKEVGWILAHSGARLVFATPDWSATMHEALAGIEPQPRVVEAGGAQYARLFSAPPLALEEPAAESLAWLFYTSGTTGRPKGAMLTHANLQAMSEGYGADVDTIAPGDCIIHAAPMSHGSGLYLAPHLLAGAAQVVPESGGFDPAEVFALAARHGRATLFAAPTMVRRLVDHAEAAGPALEGIKTIVYGGPMYVADILRALAVMGPRFAQIYGQGETPMTITAASKAVISDASHPRHLERLASVGRPQRAVQVQARGGEGREVATGEVGEVCVRGATVMKGYWNDPDASARALRGGWLWTGDLGSFDDEGFLRLRDRSKDLIISGGSNIYPREVEEALLTHPGVAEVSVVGRPDPEWGEAVVAFVVAREAAPGVEALDRHCLERIARFKRPKEYRFVAELPKNSYGKVLKTELRKRLEGTKG